MKGSRRSFLKAAAGVAAGIALGGSPAHAAARRKPNLLFLWTDEQRADTIDVYGNRKIQSPNMAKLARESVVFQNAYVSQPVCTPSRSTVMTGLWPHQSGCIQNNIPLPERTPTFPELVGDPNYRTGYFGKWHLGDEVFAQHGFEEWRSIEDIYRRHFREGRDKNALSDYSKWLAGLGYKPDGDAGAFSRAFASKLPIEHGKPKFLELQTCDFLRRRRDEPFMLYVNFLEPHMPFYGPLNDLHKPEEVDLPINFNDPIEDNEPRQCRDRVKKYVTGRYSNDLDLTKEYDWRRLIARYWGLVSQVDRSVGAILSTLEELGLAEDTIVVYTSDHGDMMGSHRLVEKSLMYQEAMRVPLMVRAPRFGLDSRVLEGHFSHIDLVPTVLDLMGAEPRTDLPGKSLLPTMRGEKPAPQPVFIEWNSASREPGAKVSSDPSARAVITPDGWKLCLYDTGEAQLFNLAADPGETTNLFGRPEHNFLVKHGLSGLIWNWQAKVGDTLELPQAKSPFGIISPSASEPVGPLIYR